MISQSASGFFAYFFTGWINIIIIFFSLFSLAYGAYSGLKGKKAQPKRSDVIVSIFTFVMGILLYCSLNVKDPLSSIFPDATLLTMIFLSALLFIMTIISIKRKTMPKQKEGMSLPFSKTRLAITIALAFVYLFLLETMGFYFTSIVFYFVFASVIALDRKYFFSHLRSRIVTSVCFVAVLFLIFRVILKVQAPSGFLF